MPEPIDRSENPFTSVLESNRYMLENEVECDVTFKVSGPDTAGGGKAEIVRAHRYMLIARNPVFRAMISGAMAEVGDSIVVPDVHPRAMRKIIKYLYCEAIDISEEDVFDLLYAAKKYLIDPVIQRCFEFLEKELTTDNLCPILNCAVFYCDDNLLDKCLKKLALNTAEVLASEGFEDLCQEGLKMIVESKTLTVTEDDVLKAAIRWCKAASARRGEEYHPNFLKTYLGDSFFHLRINKLSEDLVKSTMFACELLSEQEEQILEHLWQNKERDEKNISLSLSRFTQERRCKVEPGEMRCDFARQCSGALNTLNQPKVHTFAVSHDIVLQGIELVAHPFSCLTGVCLTVIQNDKSLFHTGLRVPAARRDTTYGKSIPLNLPRHISLQAGEFSVKLDFKGLGGTRGASVATCAPDVQNGYHVNGVHIQPKKYDSFHIGSLVFSVI